MSSVNKNAAADNVSVTDQRQRRCRRAFDEVYDAVAELAESVGMDKVEIERAKLERGEGVSVTGDNLF
jgi:hypothetical protein